MPLIDPHTSPSEISDKLIIEEFDNPQKYRPMTLYALMAQRANTNPQIKSYLFEIISDEEKRGEKVMGFIKHAWLPTLFILEQGNEKIKQELKVLLSKNWTQEEKEDFLFYIKREEAYYHLLKDM